MKKVIFFTVLILVLFSGNIFSQETQDFSIYYSRSNYTDEMQKILVRQNKFKQYSLMLQVHIDPKNSGEINKEAFINNIKKFYPQADSEGILCIDLENQLFKNLVSPKSAEDFDEAKNAFLWMIATVKENRPNIKVGFYGIPIREYYKKKKDNQSASFSLDPVLEKCDYLFPSLYTMYPDNQIGRSRNEAYLSDNLNTALSYGKRLNKPVVPFIWDIIHPSNKLYGGQLVDKNEILKNIEFIKNFRYKNTAVLGVVWWDPDYISFSKMNKTKLDIEEKEPKYIQSELLKDYLSGFMN